MEFHQILVTHVFGLINGVKRSKVKVTAGGGKTVEFHLVITLKCVGLSVYLAASHAIISNFHLAKSSGWRIDNVSRTERSSGLPYERSRVKTKEDVGIKQQQVKHDCWWVIGPLTDSGYQLFSLLQTSCTPRAATPVTDDTVSVNRRPLRSKL